jgi:hypothetical protein
LPAELGAYAELDRWANELAYGLRSIDLIDQKVQEIKAVCKKATDFFKTITISLFTGSNLFEKIYGYL